MMNNKVNKFLFEVEEMACEKCSAITGHVHTGKYLTCVHCGNQIGKTKKGWFKKFIKKFNKTL